MKKLIFFLAIGLLIVIFNSCTKQGEVKISRNFESSTHANFVSEAKETMQKILSPDDMVKLKWTSASIKTPAGGQGTEMTVFDESGENKLIFCEIGTMKMYQWKREVHLVFDMAKK
jgi:hypothetical protein